MGILSNTRELKEDVLFRASESITGSKFDATVIKYLNRVYRTLATGASEFLPEYVEDWWWLRGTAALNLEPIYDTGTISVINGTPDIVFTDAPPGSMQGRRLLVDEAPDIPLIQGHSPASVNATLDQPWTGNTDAAAKFRLLRTVYDLDTAVQVIMSPIIGFRDRWTITGLSPERMDVLYPLARLVPGFPQAFSLESETQVRFSHGGSDQGELFRIEYRFRPKISDLSDSAMSVPLVPSQWMHILSDMALTYLLIDKNDDRSNAVALAARTGLGAMLKENRRRLAKMDALAGKIVPRQDKIIQRPGRTIPVI
jgi:hypothetical protein